jgi:hypothetical protein
MAMKASVVATEDPIMKIVCRVGVWKSHGNRLNEDMWKVVGAMPLPKAKKPNVNVKRSLRVKIYTEDQCGNICHMIVDSMSEVELRHHSKVGAVYSPIN